jgi:hypothetical protein
MSEANEPTPAEPEVVERGDPTETFIPQIGPNPDGPDQQAVSAQQLPEEEAAPNLSAAAQVARTLPSEPATVNPGTSATAPTAAPDAPKTPNRAAKTTTRRRS